MTLDAVRAAAAVTYNNQHAVDVLTDFRSTLNVPGSSTTYDAQLVGKIAQAQAEAKLSVDGKVGQRTRELLSSLQQSLPADSLWPAVDADPEAKGAHYLDLLLKLGVDASLERPLLLALRGVELHGSKTHAVLSQAKYDDAFVLLTRADSTLTVREFNGATHPYQSKTGSTGTPDVNHDGVPDVGTIKPGRYLLKRQTKPAGHPSLHLVKLDGKEGIPTWRDTNQDGKVSGPELDAPDSQLATEVLLHPGFTTKQPSGKLYSSIGCQTARVEDVQAVAEEPLVDYVLVDARAALVTLGALV